MALCPLRLSLIAGIIWFLTVLMGGGGGGVGGGVGGSLIPPPIVTNYGGHLVSDRPC